MTKAKDELIIDELKEAIKANSVVTRFIKSELRKMAKTPQEISTEEAKKELELGVDEVIQNNDKLLHKIADIYVRNNIMMKDSRVERLTSNNYCISAKKIVIDELFI